VTPTLLLGVLFDEGDEFGSDRESRVVEFLY
jgi:hypothetical protein